MQALARDVTGRWMSPAWYLKRAKWAQWITVTGMLLNGLIAIDFIWTTWENIVYDPWRSTRSFSGEVAAIRPQLESIGLYVTLAVAEFLVFRFVTNRSHQGRRAPLGLTLSLLFISWSAFLVVLVGYIMVGCLLTTCSD